MAASNQLSAFERLPEIDGVYTATKGRLRCTAIALTGGDLCLFSPVAGLGASARRSLDALGRVAYLLAPNHYHHLGLREYVAAFPGAAVCAAPLAAERLRGVTGLAFGDLSAVAARLPGTMTILQPAGLKTGEVWIHSRAAGCSAWLVVDAISGPAKAQRCDQPECLKTFPIYGVRDRTAYRAWFTRQLTLDSPTLVVPCHGAVVSAPDLPARLMRLQREVLGA
jgi:hypothetical protein